MSDLEELKRLHAEFMGGTSAVGDYDEAHAALCSALIRSFPAIVARLEASQAALNEAAYALFQIKRMAPEAIQQFAADAHAKACKHLDNFPTFDKEQQ